MKKVSFNENSRTNYDFFCNRSSNICSLAGLLSALLGIYYSILGNFQYAMIGILWAVLFDWADGIFARKIKGRSDHQKAFGTQLDSLIDIFSFGVFERDSIFWKGLTIIFSASGIDPNFGCR